MLELNVQKREVLGKKVKALRQQGFIPAELYGHNRDNIHLNVPAKEFKKIFKEAGESTIINLVLDNKKFPVLIHDVAFDYLRDDVQHIDFYEVKMDEKIIASVPLEFVGEAPGVREKGGILVKAMQVIEIESLPSDLPHSLQVDLSVLTDIGTSFYVKNLAIPDKVKCLVNEDTVIATVVEQKQEEEPLVTSSIEDVKVESEEKKKEREANKSKEE